MDWTTSGLTGTHLRGCDKRTSEVALIGIVRVFDGRSGGLIDSLEVEALLRGCGSGAPDGVVRALLIGNAHRFDDFFECVSDSPVPTVFNEEWPDIWRCGSGREDKLLVGE
jgi:hypothetical protein